MEVVKMPPASDMAEAKKALDESKRKLPLILEYTLIEAKMVRAKYVALMAEGFTAQEALDLCKTWRA
jgi:hypothetical protein